MSERFRLPGDTHRLAIIGRTGTGKTQAGMWQLSRRSYDRRPWIVLDFKREQLINSVPGIRHLGIEERIPKQPGLYAVHPLPGDDDAVENLLWGIHQRTGVGLFVDEGYQMPKGSNAYQAILTQGRSLHIPVITLSQRPVDVTRFAFSEADFVQLFKLNDKQDYKRVAEFMTLPSDKRLPAPYCSWWLDHEREYTCILRPVPDKDTILNTFHDRLIQPRKVI